ncbi:alpha/beta fold hydrolase [Streptomyces sp. NPDC127033]|uniref:alpha/beta fold hydrolase n=1 Tax=Streptomyces sp. NPDC127033 TaxID=3347110 RepID=UPI003648C365
MTTFVLVSGGHTGGWVWQEVSARLRAAGAQVYEATLTGMGDRRHLARPDTDLETHIQDLVNLLDTVPAPEGVVLVGHCYGIHPVLGAADRRPERVARIVHLDAGLPQDGDVALALAPDQAIRDRLAARKAGASPDGHAWLADPPSAAEPERWGGTAGLSEAALDRLVRHAAPQPLGTLTQPLRLPNADVLAALPTTGIFCTANGSGIALVEMLVATGQPHFLALAEPRVGFFELDTGHWPMLSVPDELAGVLLRAAADEGHRVTAEQRENPTNQRPFILDVPTVPNAPDRPDRTKNQAASTVGVERAERTTTYFPEPLTPTSTPTPTSTSRPAPPPSPAIVFVHGGPLPADTRPTPRDWPLFTGYGRYVASRGAVGVTVDHRLHGLTDYASAAEDIAAAVERVRADPRVDGERVALWFFSGGGLLLADWLAAPPPWLRCVAATYPVLAPLPGWSLVERRFRPAATVAGAGPLPIVLTRVGRERPEIAATVEEFLTAAEGGGARVEVIDVPLAHHGFDAFDHGTDTEAAEQARRAVERAVRSVLAALAASPEDRSA